MLNTMALLYKIFTDCGDKPCLFHAVWHCDCATSDHGIPDGENGKKRGDFFCFSCDWLKDFIEGAFYPERFFDEGFGVAVPVYWDSLEFLFCFAF